MSLFSIVAIIPVLNRPKNVERLINSFKDNTPLDRAELLFVTGKDCKEEIEEINKFTGSISIDIAPDNIISWAKRINYGIKQSENKSTWILCGADDIIFHPNWFEIAEQKSINFDGIIGTNDLGHPATIGGWHSTHPIVSREYIKNFGVIDEPGKLCHEGYFHNYVDAEIVHTAIKRGKWIHEPKCIIEHLHPAWNKANDDDVYKKGHEKVNLDRNLWSKRKAQFNL